MVKHRTRRVRRNRKGGNIYQTLKTKVLGNKNPVSSTGTTSAEDVTISGMNPMANLTPLVNKALSLLRLVDQKIRQIDPMKIDRDILAVSPDEAMREVGGVTKTFEAAVKQEVLSKDQGRITKLIDELKMLSEMDTSNELGLSAFYNAIKNYNKNGTIYGASRRKSRRMRRKTKRFSRRR